MDWNAVGAIGEVGGAIGVVVTLIYLAGQLRQNTNALKSASYENWNVQVAEWGQYTGQHARELAEAKTINNQEELTPEQLNYLLGEFQIVLSQGECAFLKHRAGLLDDDVFEARTQSLTAYFREELNPLARQMWAWMGPTGSYTRGFADYLDKQLQPADNSTN
jgi:hypothetical protein